MNPVFWLFEWLVFGIFCKWLAANVNYNAKLGRLIGAYLDIMWIISVTVLFILLVLTPFM